MSNHCPEGCVHVTHSTVARRGMFMADGVILRLLTQASLLGGPFCRSLRCVVCTSETAYFRASMLAHCYFFTFSDSGVWTFSTLFQNFRVLTDVVRLWKGSGITISGWENRRWPRNPEDTGGALSETLSSREGRTEEQHQRRRRASLCTLAGKDAK